MTVSESPLDALCTRSGELLVKQLLDQPNPQRSVSAIAEQARGDRQFAIDDATLLAYIADRLDVDATLESLQSLNLADLGLACACANGCDVALREFEATYVGDLGKVIRRVSSTDNTNSDDILQTLRTRLFVGDPPRITGYAGRGQLFSWLRVVAVRETLSLLRKNKREVLVDEIPESAVDDLELGVFKGLYQREFKAAFAAAVTELSSRERALLKLHLIEKLSIDAIGAANNAHRTTAARWLRDIRAKLATRTRDLLGESLKLQGGDLDSVMRLVRSRLELSVSRLLEAS